MSHSDQTSRSAWIRNLDVLDSTRVLTLLLFLLSNFKLSGQGMHIQAIQMTLAAAGLLLIPLRNSRLFWGGIMATFLWTLYKDAGLTDNHIYLSSYWAAVMFISTWLKGEEAYVMVKRNALYFLVVCMLIAVIWKLIAADYRSGAFFHMVLLTGNSFKVLSAAIAPLPAVDLAANAEAYSSLLNAELPVDARYALTTRPALKNFALFLTWWTIVIEGAIVILWALPSRLRKARWLAHIVLLGFCLSTYFALPIIGFGQMLLLFGYVNCPQENSRIRSWYIASFFILQLYSGNWLHLLT